MRSFIGLEIPVNIGENYLKLLKPLKSSGVINFVSSNKIHITIAFFNDLSKENMKKVEEILKSENMSEFKIECTGLGFFKRRGIPSTVYVKVNSEKLNEYAQAIHKKLKEENIEFDSKPFVPHVTICRVKNIEKEDSFINTFKYVERKFEKLDFYCDKIYIYSSDMVVYKKEAVVELEKIEKDIDEDDGLFEIR